MRDVMEVLRDATTVHHQQLEHTVGIGQAIKDQDAYINLLKQFYGFYASLETALKSFAETHHDFKAIYEGRLKTPWLVEDLHYLGESDTDIQSLPACQQLPPIQSEAQVLGIFYVIEGSTLGGQYIAKQLASIGITPQQGGAFFNGYGPQTQTQWQAVKQYIRDSIGESEADIDLSVEAAKATFNALENWFMETYKAIPA